MSDYVFTANPPELFQTLEMYNQIFDQYWVWVVDNSNKAYHIEVKKGLWIHHPTWASTIHSADDLTCLKYPCQVWNQELPPYQCIHGLWKADNSQERFGQWFINRYVRDRDSLPLWNEDNVQKALSMIYEQYYQV